MLLVQRRQNCCSSLNKLRQPHTTAHNSTAHRSKALATGTGCRSSTCSSVAAQHGTMSGEQQQQQVHKPLCDRRNYQYAVLDNGLRVLAIQDTADAAFAAVCANVQAGYFDDAPYQLPGCAHFLEHMVHLGSAAFPDERQYKAYLAAHGGSSNASTSMVHTRYHFKVAAPALGGALDRLGAALSSPLLAGESAQREVENVHAEFSRNTNSDSRKLLQLKRSLCEPPYSGFSTGSIKTLWEEPTAAGVCVPDVLRQLWQQTYAAESTTLAVVGPQDTEELLGLVQHAFGGMRRRTTATAAAEEGDDGGSSEVKRFKAGSTTTAAEPAVDGSSDATTSSSHTASGDSSSDGSSDSEAGPLIPAAGTGAGGPHSSHSSGLTPEAVLHIKAQQEGADSAAAAAGDEQCSRIAAPHHHHNHNQQQQGEQHAAAMPQPPTAPPPQQQQRMGHHRYPVDVVSTLTPGSCGGGGATTATTTPRLVRVCPQRELRELEVVWYIPAGAMVHSGTKPWHLASHLLGHEVPGSVSHLLKAQGLVQSLSVGTGDEVRLGRGWMFWGVTMQLTEAGEAAVDHVLATLFRGVQILQSCSEAELQSHWREVSALSDIRFDWRDVADPTAAAQAAAYALHYYAPQQVLSGPALLTQYDSAAVRWFLSQLNPDTNHMTVFWSSRRHKGVVDSKEQYYGAQYVLSPLPESWLDTIQHYTSVDSSSSRLRPAATQHHPQQQQQEQPVQEEETGEAAATAAAAAAATCVSVESSFAPVAGELHLPPPNWAIPTDFTLRAQQQQQQQQQQDTEQSPHAKAAAGGGDAGATTAAGGGGGSSTASSPQDPPVCVVQQSGMCVWHKLDTSYGLPKVHLKLHIVTPAVYSTPSATVAARLLVRVLEDLLLPTAYPAELAGTCYSLSTGQGGLVLKVTGFQGVAQQLMVAVLTALRDLSGAQVSQRWSTMLGRLQQGLTNWANNNPAQHSEYAAHHLLQQHHHNNRQLLEAAAAAQPADILLLQQQLVSGHNMHLDMLSYGNISAAEAADVAHQVHKLLPAQGLSTGLLVDTPCAGAGAAGAVVEWPPLGKIADLSSAAAAAAGSVSLAAGAGVADDAAAAGGCSDGDETAPAAGCASSSAAAAEGVGGPVCVTYQPDNPNPSNSNHAVYYLLQLGPDSNITSVLSDLFVQMSSKAAFHELRTRQRLGYSVHLGGSSLQRQLGVVVRVQSPSVNPGVIAGAVRGWLGAWRGELVALADEKLDTFKQSLLHKYLEPAKSLQEAAHRAWLPIGSSRTLVFDRRQQKARVLQEVSAQQLLEWYDMHIAPAGLKHHALCVQIWGGGGGWTGEGGDERGEEGVALVVAAGEVQAFKQRLRVLPLPQMQLPPLPL